MKIPKLLKILSAPLIFSVLLFNIDPKLGEVKASNKTKPADEQDLELYRRMGITYICTASMKGSELDFEKSLVVASNLFSTVVQQKHGGFIKEGKIIESLRNCLPKNIESLILAGELYVKKENRERVGDVAKAIVAGANTVMMGSVLAGTNESPGEKILYEGRQYVIYRGMGSLDAMKSRSGSRERYGLKNEDELVPQGIEGMVPFSGSISKVIKQYCGGLQASLGYCGTKNINLLQKNGKFIRISNAGAIEAHAHDVKITKEAPNYRR